MGIMSILLYVVLFFVILPLFFWYRVGYVKRRIDSVKSKCGSCGAVRRLAQVENYECNSCGYFNKYIDENGERVLDNTYKCDGCGAAVIEGIITCTSCGLEALAK